MDTKRSYIVKKDQTLAIRIDSETVQRLERICQRWKCTRGEAVRRLIKNARA